MGKAENLGKPGIVDDCPCVQTECPIWGNCIECVRGHRMGKHHVPECMQPIFRGLIEEMARKVEYKVVEARPTPESWEKRKAKEAAEKEK
ncbi:MAG: hypothetical protein ACLFUS_05040 [Candidatus Sumerlaeia bacterium]